MHTSTKQIVTSLRGLLWIASFYMLGVLFKIYYHARVEFKNSGNVLGIGIFFFVLFVMGILYQTRHEDDLKGQTKHILTATVLLAATYGFCSLLAFAFFDKWSLPYLWFW